MNNGIDEIARICSDRMLQLDVVSNNLANTGTPGFKVEHLYANKEQLPKNSDSAYAATLFTDFSPGTMQPTGNQLDAAIQGEGFFAVQTREGIAYTRRGNFIVNSRKQLVTQFGEQVLGEKGPIVINGKDVNIDNQGNISINGARVDRLRVVKFNDPKALIRRGDSSFSDPGAGGMKIMEKPDISHRYLESANVNPIKEMAEMINIQRSFESYQKVIQTIADLDKLSTSRVGRLA